ncbi:PITH domain-containing protein C [Babesia bigemina]|uniref:PITH domain-containing protein C n=1 Tax=Babesia bigemina TaxID=5866 RepID=A0A061DEE4_BABBI|nr:PITH domain-containing protein C [Babesia bigemina]CDR97135.1 PITH domain-containing protein C [Babesia bigemina]|eukprot:XP_012769321.1 PITH domain-containing protein C [Babesia bigemina]
MHFSGCGCKAEHELGTSAACLRSQIDLDGVRVFNSDASPESGNLVFKPYNSRLSEETLRSDPASDNELLFTLRFYNPSDVAQLLVVNDTTQVLHVRLYANRQHFDFSDVEDVTPTQELDLPPDAHGSFLHKLSFTKFKDVSDLALHFSGEEPIELRYIGLRGKSRVQQANVVDAKYELVPTASFQESLAEVKNFKYV